MEEEYFDVNSDIHIDTKSLMAHIRFRLMTKGIHFTPTKLDYNVLTYVIRKFKEYKKTDYSVIKYTDECIAKIGEAHGVTFLATMLKEKFGKKHPAFKEKPKDTKIRISKKLKTRMEELKNKHKMG